VCDDTPVEFSNFLARSELSREDFEIDLPLGVIVELRQVVNETIDKLDRRRAIRPFIVFAAGITVRPALRVSEKAKWGTGALGEINTTPPPASEHDLRVT